MKRYLNVLCMQWRWPSFWAVAVLNLMLNLAFNEMRWIDLLQVTAIVVFCYPLVYMLMNPRNRSTWK